MSVGAVFPFSAIVGQAPLKQALLLCAIDPSLGGVLVRGPRGVAKTTLARALGELLPGRFVELPLGASEERVTGTLDLDAALQEGRVQFSPGLLARADQGVLYVDEVNLLPDSLVDLLLDAAATGRNSVERDGVSHVHAARFVLVGTMNPDEGELRPQLIDRFGLSAWAQAEISPAERAEIVTRRLDFDRDSDGFVARYAREQSELLARCQSARARAATIPLQGPALALVAEHCYAARVEGVRADLAMLRAARAHAAWHERDAIGAEDVAAVSELALAHRRRGKAESGSSGGSGGGQGGPAAHGGGRTGSPSPTGSAPSQAQRAGSDQASSLEGQACDAGQSSAAGSGAAPEAGGTLSWAGASAGANERGALAPVAVRVAGVAELPSWIAPLRSPQPEHRRRGIARVPGSRGAARRSAAARGPLDLFGTLVAKAAHGARSTPHLRRTDLRYRRRHAPAAQLWVVAIDCSASMLRGGALARAKAVGSALQLRATRAGARLMLIAFQGESARLERTSLEGRHLLADAITDLGAGGGTPLRQALREAFSWCAPTRGDARAKRLVLLTDARTREPLHDLRPPQELSAIVVDCERTSVRLGRASQLASSLSGRYIHIDELV